jgi:hypothetical protein
VVVKSGVLWLGRFDDMGNRLSLTNPKITKFKRAVRPLLLLIGWFYHKLRPGFQLEQPPRTRRFRLEPSGDELICGSRFSASLPQRLLV